MTMHMVERIMASELAYPERPALTGEVRVMGCQVTWAPERDSMRLRVQHGDDILQLDPSEVGGQLIMEWLASSHEARSAGDPLWVCEV